MATPFRDIVKTYGQDSTREILKVGEEGSPLVQELLKVVHKVPLEKERRFQATSIEFINKLKEAKATGFAQQIDSEAFTANSTSYMPYQYTKGIILDDVEYANIVKAQTAEEVVALEGFLKDKISPIADAIYKGIERDLIVQKAGGALGLDSLELMAGQGIYQGLDGATLSFWKGSYVEHADTLDKLLKYEDSESLTNLFLQHEYRQGSLIGKTTPAALYAVGKNVFEVYRRSLDRKGIAPHETAHPNIITHKGVSIVKIDHPSWDTKMNKAVKIGRKALTIKSDANRIMPNSFSDFIPVPRTTDAFEFFSCINIAIGVRMRSGLGMTLYTGLPADREI